ncbi:MAG TPA: hypothetical protein VGK63_11430 [Candidatus Limnocylindrales bacterium]
MAARHRDGRGRHGGGRSAARSFSAHAPDARRRSPGDTTGSSSVVRPEADAPWVATDGAELAAADAPASVEASNTGLVEPEPTPAPPRMAEPHQNAASSRNGATPAQLRRFIKSRPYVPLHELRRRFGLNGHEDDVVPIDLPERRVWIGLPADEGRMLAELVHQGEVGCELSIDPASPVVVGVFPIRPLALGRAAHPTGGAEQRSGVPTA